MKTVIMLFGILLCSAAVAQEDQKLLIDRAAGAQPALLVLGTVHLHNPGRDAINIQVDDVLAPDRQAQIVMLVDQLAAYKPTHIAVEHPATDQEKLDELYASYRAGTRALAHDEEEQIGMRLAAKLGLARLYAVDWNGMPPAEIVHYDFSAYAKSKGQEDRLKLLLNPKRIPYPPLASADLVTFFHEINRPEIIAQSHRIYFDVARFGDAEAQPGANWVGNWYARNLKIFSNLVDITDKADDRILVIYGAGHSHYLRQFAQESGAFRLHEVREFVKPVAKGADAVRKD
ncbi:MAG: DUF5694 domain-containing protein [Proteobacteria bacterium]|nr:DUF5694 domain-containing protein [Pseudomonadota bacterium]